MSGSLRLWLNLRKGRWLCSVLRCQGRKHSQQLSAGGIDKHSKRKPCSVQAAVLGVPFVDVISTMSDPALPATVTEYEVTPIFEISNHETSNQESVSCLLQPIVQKRAIHPSQDKVAALAKISQEYSPNYGCMLHMTSLHIHTFINQPSRGFKQC